MFGAFCLGLLPFMLTQLQLRVFYSFHESKTPAVIGMLMLVVGVIGYMVARVALPPTHIVIGLAFAFDIMTLAGAIIAWPLLLRRVGSLDGWRITRSLVRMLLATLPGLLFAFVVMAVVGLVPAPGTRLRPGGHGSWRRRGVAALRALLPDFRHRGIPHPDADRSRQVRVGNGMTRVAMTGR